MSKHVTYDAIGKHINAINRIHSDSWGGGFWYDSYCLEVDQYLSDNDDFLIVFAAGNNGQEGYGSILSPGLSKNAVAVAASYSSSQIDDIAYFSSVGPAPDGRNKPVRPLRALFFFRFA